MLAAADNRVQARLQLWHIKRFDEVVVGARLKTFELVVELISGSQHDNRRRYGCVVSQPLANRQAIHARQHDVQYDRVVGVSDPKVHRGEAVASIVDDIIGSFQIRADGLCQLLVVLDEQYTPGGIFGHSESQLTMCMADIDTNLMPCQWLWVSQMLLCRSELSPHNYVESMS